MEFTRLAKVLLAEYQKFASQQRETTTTTASSLPPANTSICLFLLILHISSGNLIMGTACSRFTEHRALLVAQRTRIIRHELQNTDQPPTLTGK